MVVCMEAWFLADPAAVRRHFGPHTRANALPGPELAESRTKDAIARALDKAAAPTKARVYKKIRDGAKILAFLDPSLVRKHCLWCERLFMALGQAIEVRS